MLHATPSASVSLHRSVNQSDGGGGGHTTRSPKLAAASGRPQSSSSFAPTRSYSSQRQNHNVSAAASIGGGGRPASGASGGAHFHASPSNITTSQVSLALQSAAKESSGLGLAVYRNNLRIGLARDISEGQRALREENVMFEEILAEKHHMITAEDMAAVLRGGGGGGDSSPANNSNYQSQRSSAILAARKPVQRLLVRQRGAERARLTAAEGPQSALVEQRTRMAMLTADAGYAAPEVSVVRSVVGDASNNSNITAANGGSNSSTQQRYGGGLGGSPAASGSNAYTFNAALSIGGADGSLHGSAFASPPRRPTATAANATTASNNSNVSGRGLNNSRLHIGHNYSHLMSSPSSSLRLFAASTNGDDATNDGSSSAMQQQQQQPLAAHLKYLGSRETLSSPAHYAGYRGGGLGPNPTDETFYGDGSPNRNGGSGGAEGRSGAQHVGLSHSNGEVGVGVGGGGPRSHSSAAVIGSVSSNSRRGMADLTVGGGMASSPTVGFSRPRSAALFPDISRVGSGGPLRGLANRVAASDPSYFSPTTAAMGGGGGGGGVGEGESQTATRGVRSHSLITSLNALSPHNARPAGPLPTNANGDANTVGSASTSDASSSEAKRRRRAAYRPSAANSQRINYRELLLEQDELQHRANMRREQYDALLDEALRFQELQIHFGGGQ